MSRTNTKTVFRMFYFWEARAESRWLAAQAARGWHLQDIRAGMLYRFARGEKGACAFHIDFFDENHDEFDDYLQQCREDGWEHVCSLGNRHYFCAPKDTRLSEAFFDEDGFSLSRHMPPRVIVLLANVLMFIVLAPKAITDGISVAALLPIVLSVNFALIMVMFVLFYTGRIARSRRELVAPYMWMYWQEDRFLDFLQFMAAKGWIISGFRRPRILPPWQPYGFVFRRDKPRQLLFRADYRKLGKGDLDDYVQLCADTGWQLGVSQRTVHVFYADAKIAKDNDFFSDAQSAVEKYRRVQRQIMISGVIFFSVMYYVYFHSWVASHMLANRDSYFTVSLFTLMAVFYVYTLARLELLIRDRQAQKRNKPQRWQWLRQKWRFWHDVIMVIGLTLALLPVSGLLLPSFHFTWDWYIQSAIYMMTWTTFMVWVYAWQNRRVKRVVGKMAKRQDGQDRSASKS